MATGKTKADAVRARAAEMVAMFEAALDGELVSPIRRLKLQRAADLSALAEATRSACMAGAATLATLIAIEETADKARRDAGVY
jgi:hypothetical protein